MSVLILLVLAALAVGALIYAVYLERQKPVRAETARRMAAEEARERLQQEVSTAAYSVAVKEHLAQAISDYGKAVHSYRLANIDSAVAIGSNQFKSKLREMERAGLVVLDKQRDLDAVVNWLPWFGTAEDGDELARVRADVRARMGEGNCAVVVSTLGSASSDELGTDEREWLRAWAVSLGMTPDESDEFITRVEHVGPQPIVRDISLTGAVIVKTELEAMGVKAQVRERAGGGGAREPIPESVRNEVWRRDQGRCVDCGSRERLEFDHIIPVSQGGSNTARNIELRCESCNRRKGATV